MQRRLRGGGPWAAALIPTHHIYDEQEHRKGVQRQMNASEIYMNHLYRVPTGGVPGCAQMRTRAILGGDGSGGRYAEGVRTVARMADMLGLGDQLTRLLFDEDGVEDGAPNPRTTLGLIFCGAPRLLIRATEPPLFLARDPVCYWANSQATITRQGLACTLASSLGVYCGPRSKKEQLRKRVLAYLDSAREDATPSAWQSSGVPTSGHLQQGARRRPGTRALDWRDPG
eukprot:COSAG02_NODE_15114_length_1202_cov_3.199456_1_plen_228_part_00